MVREAGSAAVDSSAQVIIHRIIDRSDDAGSYGVIVGDEDGYSIDQDTRNAWLRKAR